MHGTPGGGGATYDADGAPLELEERFVAAAGAVDSVYRQYDLEEKFVVVHDNADDDDDNDDQVEAQTTTDAPTSGDEARHVVAVDVDSASSASQPEGEWYDETPGRCCCCVRSHVDACDVVGVALTVCLAPVIAIAYALIIVLSLPFVGLCAWYSHRLGPVEDLDRARHHFAAFAAVAIALHVPVIVLELVYCVFIFVVAHGVSLVPGLLLRGPCRIAANVRALAPFTKLSVFKMPSLAAFFGDVVATTTAAQHRLGPWEFALRYWAALAVNPVLKYVFLANPFLGRLAVRRSCLATPLAFARTVDDAMVLVRHNVSRFLPRQASLVHVDTSVFAATYPRPPRDRRPTRWPSFSRFAARLGGPAKQQEPSNKTTTTTTTSTSKNNNNVVVEGDQPPRRALATALGYDYALDAVHLAVVGHTIADDDDDPEGSVGTGTVAPVSRTARHLGYAIFLSYWNPLHALTAYVEVNARDDLVLERPMWCVLGAGAIPRRILADVAEPFFLYAPDATHAAQRRAASKLGAVHHVVYQGRDAPQERRQESPEETADVHEEAKFAATDEEAEVERRRRRRQPGAMLSCEAAAAAAVEVLSGDTAEATKEQQREEGQPPSFFTGDDVSEGEIKEDPSSNNNGEDDEAHGKGVPPPPPPPDDDDAASFAEDADHSDDASDAGAVRVVESCDATAPPGAIVDVTFETRELGFGVALAADKTRGTARVVVDEVAARGAADGDPSKTIRLDDEILKIDDDAPNGDVLAHEDHGAAHFAALVRRIKQGPRPVTIRVLRHAHSAPEDGAPSTAGGPTRLVRSRSTV